MTTTFNGLGAVPFDQPHNLGMPGMHGTIPANYALRDADLILTLGGRFDDRVAVRGFAAGKRIVHVDIDPSEIDKTVATDLNLVAGPTPSWTMPWPAGAARGHPDWMAQVAAWRGLIPRP